MEALAAVGSADGGSKLAGGDGKRIGHSNPGGIIAEITVGEIIENLSLRCYGGQRQLEVGLALACDPKVLLLDEPTAGMSPEETARMRDLIRQLPGSLTMVIIEHDMDLVMDIADRITVLDYGSVLTQGTPTEIRASELVRERYLGGAAANPAGAS